MAAFVYGGRKYNFDVTNADDLARLQRACADMEAEEKAIVERYTQDGDTVEELRAVHRMYVGFFSTLFPERGADIIGKAPSAADSIRAFQAFLGFLEDCRRDEARLTEELFRTYASASAFSAGGGNV